MAYSDLTLEEKREVLMEFDNHGGDYDRVMCWGLSCGDCPFNFPKTLCDVGDHRQERYEQVQSMLAEVAAEIENQGAINAQSKEKEL